MQIAYLKSADGVDVNATLAELAARLIDQGLQVVGTTQTNTARTDTHKCDMDVRVLPDGEIIRISQNLGPKSRGCQLDPDALEQAVAATLTRLEKADLLIINKTDLAPYVGASLDVMERDATRMRAGKPFVFASLRHGKGVDEVITLIEEIGGLVATA